MLNKTGRLALIVFFAVVSLLCTETARAQTPLVAKITYITSDKPFEVPGKVLPAGRYMIRLVNLGEVRNVVRILSPDEKTVYGTWQTVPSYKLEPVNDNTLTFYEAPQDMPRALRTWFYHGTQWGFDFLYPKEQADKIASYHDQAVLRAPVATAAVQTDDQAVDQNATAAAQPMENPAAADEDNDAQSASQLSAQEAEAPAPSDNTETAMPQQTAALDSTPVTQEATPVPAEIPSELPKTASSVPLFGFAGLLAMIAAGGVRRLRKQPSNIS